MADNSMFGGAHPKSGPWETLKGSMLAPHELPYDVQDQNMGDARFNGLVSNGVQSWDKFIKPSEGLTRGTDKHMPR